MELVFGGAALVLLLVVCGECLKGQGASPRQASGVNLLLSVGVALGYTYVTHGTAWVQSGCIGLGLGFAASGVYSVGKTCGMQWFGGTRAYYARLAAQTDVDARFVAEGE